jgi:uncharacterized protein (DUF433 family)
VSLSFYLDNHVPVAIAVGLRQRQIDVLLSDYPCLERDDILAAIAYAAQQTNHVVVEVA